VPSARDFLPPVLLSSKASLPSAAASSSRYANLVSTVAELLQRDPSLVSAVCITHTAAAACVRC
jgi:hypothetical protein